MRGRIDSNLGLGRTWAAAILPALLCISGTSYGQGRPSNASASTMSRAVARFEQMPKPVVLPDGTWMAFFHPVKTPMREVVARTSGDSGRSWSKPEILLKLPQETGAWGYLLPLLGRNGEIHLFFLNDANTGILQPLPSGPPSRDRLDIWYARSSGGRRTWSPPRRIWEGRAGDLQSAIQLRDGRILLPISYMIAERSWRNRGEGPDRFTYSGKFECSALYSDDDGGTWRPSPSVLKVQTPDITTILGAVEPVVLELKDGRVWMLLRTQRGRFYESFSTDRGATWSQPEAASIFSSDSPAGLVRLRDGRILMIWNNCLRFPYAYGGRHVLHAALSDDEGRSWRGFREILRDPLRLEPPPPSGDFGVSYPFPDVTHDGKVVFSLWVDTASDRSLMLLDPRSLEESSQKADFAAGLEDWSTFGTSGVELAAHPEQASARVLRIRKADPAGTAAAVWNFPLAAVGLLRVRVRLERGFGGANVGITDHFSVPFDPEDHLYNLYTLRIGPDGRLDNGTSLPLGRWVMLELRWDSEKRLCRVRADGKQVAVLRQLRESTGASYLRLRSTAKRSDAGLLVETVEEARVASTPAGR